MSKKVKKSRLTFLIAVVVLLVLLPIAISLLQNAKKAEAAWMDDNYAYRNRVPISSHTAAESNVYVTVTLDTSASGQFQSDCGDLRFTDVTGNQLPYYIVSGCTTASTVIHVFFKSMPAGAQELYYYYGNPSAANGFVAADFSTQASSYAVGSIGSQEKGGAPIAYWKFDEGTGTTTTDSSSNKTVGTITGATWQTEDQCISGKCLYFNGTTAYVDLGTSVGNYTDNFTVSAWVRTATKNTRILSRRETANGTQYDLYIQASTGKASFYDGTTEYPATTDLTDNKWHFISWSINGASSKIYVDGNLERTFSPTIVAKSVSTLIGALNKPSLSGVMNGFIDDVKIYNYVRTAAQIKSDFVSRGSIKGSSARLGSSSRNLDALSNGLVGYWKMDEASWTNDCSTTSVTDSSGNGNNGKACPATTGPTGGAAGKFGNGGGFDGGDDYISIPSSVPITTNNQITVTQWYKPAVGGGDPRIVNRGWCSAYGWLSHKGYGFGVNDSTGCSAQYWASYGSMTNGQWYFLVGVFDGQKTYAYKDGNLITTTNAPNVNLNSNNYSIELMTGNSGQIDDVRIYNRALSPKEIRDLYNWAPGPRVYLKMEEGLGTSANDDSGNGRTGTLNGNPVWSSGKFGKGVKLDGTGDFIQISDF